MSVVKVPEHVLEAAKRVQWSPNSGREDANILATWVQSLPVKPKKPKRGKKVTHQLENSERVLERHHSEEQCVGEHCTLHNMSDHALRSFEQRWNGAFMERVAPDGAVWQDPDDTNQQKRPNAALCLGCGVLLYSRYRHDFKECECGNLMVDGGAAYIRRGWKDEANIEEIKSWPVPAGWR
jgi:hypothetical protein